MSEKEEEFEINQTKQIQANKLKTIETGTIEDTIEATNESNKKANNKKHPEISIENNNKKNKKSKKKKLTKLTKAYSS
jgi:hypothetical protein